MFMFFIDVFLTKLHMEINQVKWYCLDTWISNTLFLLSSFLIGQKQRQNINKAQNLQFSEERMGGGRYTCRNIPYETNTITSSFIRKTSYKK